MNWLTRPMTAALLGAAMSAVAQGGDTRQWPAQRTPERLLTLNSIAFEVNEGQRPERNYSDDHMLAQSLAGLSAKAVNESRFGEMVAVHLWNNRDYSLWLHRVVERTGIDHEDGGTVWDVVERWRDAGVFGGYILYTRDESEGLLTTLRPGSDESANVAMSLSGPMRAIAVSEGQRARAESLGLEMLFDARGKTERWLFERHRDRFDRGRLLLQDPGMANNRAIAVAHDIMTVYGQDDLAEEIYEWMDTPGFVFGWNSGDEGAAVAQLTRWGHTLTPSNWAINLPVMSIGADDVDWPRFGRATPTPTSGPGDDRVPLAMFLSDGDNLQWVLGSFVNNPEYWGAPTHGLFPMSFFLPIDDMLSVAPDAYLELHRTKPATTAVSMAPGYWYPDLLGEHLDPRERRRLLTIQGRRIQRAIEVSGVDHITMLAKDVRGERVREALAVLAEAAPSLRGGALIQYAPYTGGEGEAVVVERRAGPPAVFHTMAYCLWDSTTQPRTGGPERLARIIEAIEGESERATTPRVVSIHAWSQFRDGADSFRGVAAALLLAEVLGDGYRLTTIDDAYPPAGRDGALR